MAHLKDIDRIGEAGKGWLSTIERPHGERISMYTHTVLTRASVWSSLLDNDRLPSPSPNYSYMLFIGQLDLIRRSFRSAAFAALGDRGSGILACEGRRRIWRSVTEPSGGKSFYAVLIAELAAAKRERFHGNRR